MNKKYFVCSDIHSFFNEWLESLNNAGFDINNQNHILIVNGDLFDHGDQTLECFNFVKIINSMDRLIYIKGNHEHEWLKTMSKKLPDDRAFKDGTLKSFCEFANEDYEWWLKNWNIDSTKTRKRWKKILEIVQNSGVIDFIKNNCINYIEIDKYIITHSFYPVKWNIKNPTLDDLRHCTKEQCEYDPKWRVNKNDFEWHGASWQNPIWQYQWGNFRQEEKKNKLLLCGHWGNPDLCRILKKKTKEPWKILKYKNTINLDAKTRHTGKVNCFVIK